MKQVRHTQFFLKGNFPGNQLPSTDTDTEVMVRPEVKPRKARAETVLLASIQHQTSAWNPTLYET
ncbi:MAG: hypothetical protein MRQ07_04885 [Candidatus Midichloria sp.]|nr:hypothetical protein [Candidatus Midichloria sp.]